ncbi:MAG: DUF4397 domain-containing protein [Acidimicrobiia bacterium]
MRRTLPIAALVAAFLLVLAPSASAQESARIHLIHGIPDTPVDVVAGGEVVFGDFQFGDTQDLSGLAGQTLTGLTVNAAGTDTVAIDAGDVTLPSSGNVTIIAHLTEAGEPTLSTFTNDTSSTAAGEGRLTVRHTAAAPAVDVLAGGQPAFTGLANPNEASADLPVGTISASVVPAGATEPVVIGPADLAIEDGTNLIVYAVGSLDGGTIQVLTESITGLGTAPTAVNTGNSPVADAGGAPIGLLAVAGLAVLALAVPARRLLAVRAR